MTSTPRGSGRPAADGPAAEGPMRLSALRRHAEELGFTPRDQVRWLAPRELLRTAVQVALAAAFASYTDKRELQRSLPGGRIAVRPDDEGGFWFDYVADLGDGFDPTYTVALLLAREELDVVGPDGAALTLPRGRMLTLGGDEVYPTASSAAYDDRFRGPYRMALPQSATDDDPPTLVALPGNHDWYDGLTAFLRVFGQERRLGGWQTAQGRSYFAVRLPQHWWLVGLDDQAGSEIDGPQLDYFREHLTEKLEPGDGVILLCPKPVWVRTGEDFTAFDSLQFFDRRFVRTRLEPGDDGRERPVDTGARVRLWLTGDQHHYARYAEEVADPGDGTARQLMTCGLGGAYLSATHRLPEELGLPPRTSRLTAEGEEQRYRLAARWPSAEVSRTLVRGLFSLGGRGLPFRNPGFWRLGGVVHAVLLAVLAGLLGLTKDMPPTSAIRDATAGDALALGGQLGLWLAVLIAGWCLLPVRRWRPPRPPNTVIVGTVVQLVIAVGALVLVVVVVRAVNLPAWFPGGRSLPDFLMFGLALLLTGFVGGFLGSYGFALTLALGRERTVQDWQTSAQAIEERKGFLRIHVEPGGDLVVHPVVVDEVCHEWDLVDAPPGASERKHVRPHGPLPTPYLAEPPIRIRRDPSAPERPHSSSD